MRTKNNMKLGISHFSGQWAGHHKLSKSPRPTSDAPHWQCNLTTLGISHPYHPQCCTALNSYEPFRFLIINNEDDEAALFPKWVGTVGQQMEPRSSGPRAFRRRHFLSFSCHALPRLVDPGHFKFGSTDCPWIRPISLVFFTLPRD